MRLSFYRDALALPAALLATSLQAEVITDFEAGSVAPFQSVGLVSVTDAFAPIDFYPEPIYAPQGQFFANLDNAGGADASVVEAQLNLTPGTLDASRASALVHELSVTAGQQLTFLYNFERDSDTGNISTDNDRGLFIVDGQVFELGNMFTDNGPAFSSFTFRFEQSGSAQIAFLAVEQLDPAPTPGSPRTGIDGDGLHASLLIDDVRLIPEPSSLLILATLAAGVTRRRPRRA